MSLLAANDCEVQECLDDLKERAKPYGLYWEVSTWFIDYLSRLEEERENWKEDAEPPDNIPSYRQLIQHNAHCACFEWDV